MEKSIEFTLKTIVNQTETIWEQGKNFLKSHGFSDDSVQTQIMVIKELIKSSQQFDDMDPSEKEITVHLNVESSTITTEIRKAVNESGNADQLQELDQTIQWIRGYQDPFAPYMIQRHDAYNRSHVRRSIGLGLTRIAYEAGAILDFYVSEDNILNLFAITNLNGDNRS